MLDLNEILDKIFDGGHNDKRDYKQFPECRPWPALAFEMIRENPKRLKSLSTHLQEAFSRVLSPHSRIRFGSTKKLTLWQIFNNSMQFDVGEEFIWFRLSQRQKEGTFFTEEFVRSFFEEELNLKPKEEKDGPKSIRRVVKETDY